MSNRRDVLAGALGASFAASSAPAKAPVHRARGLRLLKPCVISTWDFGVAANQAAFAVLEKGGPSLDAVEAGVRVPEADLSNHYVGRAGYPDRDGHVTLDASIMDHDGRCGAVAAIEHIAHPISVARRVMERTPHVLLVGDGALQFALEQGFPREELLTPESKAAWEQWRKDANYQPQAGPPGSAANHDTIGMLALDAQGRLAGACTTSGMAWKLRGRVGDSPIIGAGLYVDGDVGGATSTGVGEEVIRTCGSFLVVELMRQGLSPQAACEAAVERIRKKKPGAEKTIQVGFLALNRHGEVGAFALQSGFTYALCDAAKRDRVLPSKSVA